MYVVIDEHFIDMVRIVIRQNILSFRNFFFYFFFRGGGVRKLYQGDSLLELPKDWYV